MLSNDREGWKKKKIQTAQEGGGGGTSQRILRRQNTRETNDGLICAPPCCHCNLWSPIQSASIHAAACSNLPERRRWILGGGTVTFRCGCTQHADAVVAAADRHCSYDVTLRPAGFVGFYELVANRSCSFRNVKRRVTDAFWAKRGV